MMKRLRIGLLIAGALAFAIPSTAQAQSCGSIYAAKRQVENAKAELFLNYPGTAVTLLGCAANAADQPESSQATSFLACGAVVCFFIGYDVCGNLAGGIIEIARADEMVKDAIRRNGC